MIEKPLEWARARTPRSRLAAEVALVASVLAIAAMGIPYAIAGMP